MGTGRRVLDAEELLELLGFTKIDEDSSSTEVDGETRAASPHGNAVGAAKRPRPARGSSSPRAGLDEQEDR